MITFTDKKLENLEDSSEPKHVPFLGFPNGVSFVGLEQGNEIDVSGIVYFEPDPELGSYALSHPDTIRASKDPVRIILC